MGAERCRWRLLVCATAVALLCCCGWAAAVGPPHTPSAASIVDARLTASLAAHHSATECALPPPLPLAAGQCVSHATNVSHNTGLELCWAGCRPQAAGQVSRLTVLASLHTSLIARSLTRTPLVSHVLDVDYLAGCTASRSTWLARDHLQRLLGTRENVCVCACVCVCERERERR
jgi:hypothetical protein